MRQIKTVLLPYDKAAQFDAEVNALLADGWQLKRHEVLKVQGPPNEAFSFPIFPALYAELTREVPPYPEEITI